MRTNKETIKQNEAEEVEEEIIHLKLLWKIANCEAGRNTN